MRKIFGLILFLIQIIGLGVAVYYNLPFLGLSPNKLDIIASIIMFPVTSLILIFGSIISFVWFMVAKKRKNKFLMCLQFIILALNLAMLVFLLIKIKVGG